MKLNKTQRIVESFAMYPEMIGMSDSVISKKLEVSRALVAKVRQKMGLRKATHQELSKAGQLFDPKEDNASILRDLATVIENEGQPFSWVPGWLDSLANHLRFKEKMRKQAEELAKAAEEKE